MHKNFKIKQNKFIQLAQLTVFPTNLSSRSTLITFWILLLNVILLIYYFLLHATPRTLLFLFLYYLYYFQVQNILFKSLRSRLDNSFSRFQKSRFFLTHNSKHFHKVFNNTLNSS